MSNGDVRETLFELPSSPDEFGVILPPSNLRRLDFSGLDYDTARRAIIEYIRTYFPDDFNDFVASNGIMMIMEIVAATTSKLSLRSDILVNESFLPTATTEEAVVNHLALINQRIKRQTPAIVDIECTVDFPIFTDIHVPAGTQFSISGPDNRQIFYEIYRAPNDWSSDIIIPANKRGVIAWGIEGRFGNEIIEVSAGGPNQEYTIVDAQILEAPIFVEVTLDSTVEEWQVIREPIERYAPNDKVVEVNFIGQRAVFNFGDDITGKSPVAGSEISFRYRVGGGRRGRIGVGQIDTSRQFTANPPANASTSVNFRNITPSSGGTDKESISTAKRRAPRDFAVQRSIVTASDYAQSAESFSHPAFGAVAKAVATIRTGLNANRVEIYVLAEGPDNIPTAPNAGLKAGLKTFFSDLNVLTDNVVVLDGALRPVDIDMNVIIDRNADASVVKTRVESVLDDFFDITNWDMGEPMYVSNLIEAVEAVDGVIYVDLFAPRDNILQTGELADDDADGIGVNQVIVEGERTTNYYYNKTSQ